MWRLSHILCRFQLWFADRLPLDTERGALIGGSSRLIIDGQGFLDLTTTSPTPALSIGEERSQPDHWEIIANGVPLWANRSVNTAAACPSFHDIADAVALALKINQHGDFELAIEVSHILAGMTSPQNSTQTFPACIDNNTDCYDTPGQVSGKLTPLPTIHASDIELIDQMIDRGVIPYQNIPVSPGKPMEEIRALGTRLFPFTPHSFQLALCVYDWTTPSFARLVLLKIFEYTGLKPAPLFPLDQASIAETIWATNWSTYTPQDVDYMRSFLMEPSNSFDDVQTQLETVRDDLHRLSDVQNRLLAAATYSLPRTSIVAAPMLYSGQMDISQLGLDHFGIEFLESPLNSGPVGRTLVSPLADALSSYLAPGRTVTTKTAWSFTDKLEDAVHYANGILIILHPAEGSWVWDQPAFITPLSDDPGKNEYVSAPGTAFEVLAVECAAVLGEEVIVITLQHIHRSKSTTKIPATEQVLFEERRF